MKQLEQLEQGLIDKAQIQRIADDLSKAAEIKYDMAIENAMKADPELRELWDKRQEAHTAAKTAKVAYTEAKANAVKELGEVSDPDDYKAFDAFSYRQYVEPVYEDEYEFIKAVADSGMLFLLKPDEAAIKSFVLGMAYEHKELKTYFMPGKIFGILPELGVQVVIKPTISDAKIAKSATK